MTANKSFKRRVRARAARTGESYQAAYHRFLAPTEEIQPVTTMSDRPSIAVAIHTLEHRHAYQFEPTPARLADRRLEIADAIADAASAGGRLVAFPEYTFGVPGKGVLLGSKADPREADWTIVDWEALRTELGAIADAARRHRVWVVIGSPHQLTAGRRPHNSLYVISDSGEVVTRYDKRRLSTTEINYMNTPGTEPIVFDVEGLRVGLLLGLEVLFPDLFTEYADLGADLILACSSGGGIFEQLVRSYAVVTGVPVALVIPASVDDASAAGIYGWDGPLGVVSDKAAPRTLVTAVAKRDAADENLWFTHKARHGFYDAHLAPDDPRTRSRSAF